MPTPLYTYTHTHTADPLRVVGQVQRRHLCHKQEKIQLSLRSTKSMKYTEPCTLHTWAKRKTEL